MMGSHRRVVSRLVLTLCIGVVGMADPAAGQTTKITVEPGLGGRLPSRFTGLSFEASTLPAVARSFHRGTLVPLLRSLGPGVLRFGGSSVDANTAFVGSGHAPSWATTTIRPEDFQRLETLARLTRWRLIVAIGLGHYSPPDAAREAAAARSMGAALSALEIGNEPNAYWFTQHRPPSWGYMEYRQEIRAYRRAITSAAPGVSIAGPDTTQERGSRWLRRFARDERPAMLTSHYYPLDCFGPRAPTLTSLLGPQVALEEASSLSSLVAVGRAYNIPVRVGEVNSVGCGGQAGVSDTFGSALWALRYALVAVRRGIAGVNFHTLLTNCHSYSIICAPTAADYARSRLRATPAYYALLLMRQAAKGHLANISMSRSPSHLTIEAFRSGAHEPVHVVAVNTSPAEEAPIAVRLAGHQAGLTASVMTLTATGLRKRAGVRLGGESVSGAGTWRPRRPWRRIPTVAGAVRYTVRGGTGAVLRVTPRPLAERSIRRAAARRRRRSHG